MNEKIIGWEIKKRTFEGEHDESKNVSAVTSKYRKSLKYILLYEIQFEHGGVATMCECFKTKKEAIQAVEIMTA